MNWVSLSKLGVGDIDFVSCSFTVYQAMLVNWMRNLEVGFPSLEDGIDLLVCIGEYDLFYDWLVNSGWVHSMEWSGQKEFITSPEVPFIVDDSETEDEKKKQKELKEKFDNLCKVIKGVLGDKVDKVIVSD